MPDFGVDQINRPEKAAVCRLFRFASVSYAARDGARRAWQKTNAQLEISGLDDGKVERADAADSAAAFPSSSPPRQSPSSPEAGSTHQETARGGDANHPSGARAASRKERNG